MSTAAVGAQTPPVARPGFKRSFLLVFACTLINACAQLLMKFGSANIGDRTTLADVIHNPVLIFRFALGIISNWQLFCGYCLFGVVTLLMAAALKGRELSRLFPIIALTYVWVTILSVTLLNEHMNFFRSLGIAFVVGGVSRSGVEEMMTHSVATPLSSIILMLFSSFVGSFGAVFLKYGAEHMQGNLASLIKNYWLAIGVALYLLSSVFFVMGIAHGEMTILYPMVSIGYIWLIRMVTDLFQGAIHVGEDVGTADDHLRRRLDQLRQRFSCPRGFSRFPRNLKTP